MEVLLLIVNLLISVWNAFVWGYTRRELKAVGPRSFYWWLSWCIFIMSAIGFFTVYLVAGAVLGLSNEWFTMEQAKWAFDLGFVIIWPLLIATGLAITVFQWAITFREGGFLNWGVSVWNTYAMINNVSVGVQHYGTALDSVGSMFSSSDGFDFNLDGDSAKALPVIILVVVCLLLACGTTWLIGHLAGKFRKDLTQEEFDAHLAKAPRD